MHAKEGVTFYIVSLLFMLCITITTSVWISRLPTSCIMHDILRCDVCMVYNTNAYMCIISIWFILLQTGISLELIDVTAMPTKSYQQGLKGKAEVQLCKHHMVNTIRT